MEENGSGNGQVRVKFGPGITQDIPLSWAEVMLDELRRTKPQVFGSLLVKAAKEAQ